MMIHSIKINTFEEEQACIDFSKKTKEFCDSKGLNCILPAIEFTEEIYNKTNYKDIYNKIIDEFNIEEFTEKINLFFNNPELLIDIRISAYGTYGYYWPHENKIFVNIHSGNIISTIKHEIIHLIIEPYIQKYNIGHEEKERLVNSLSKCVI